MYLQLYPYGFTAVSVNAFNIGVKKISAMLKEAEGWYYVPLTAIIYVITVILPLHFFNGKGREQMYLNYIKAHVFGGCVFNVVASLVALMPRWCQVGHVQMGFDI